MGNVGSSGRNLPWPLVRLLCPDVKLLNTMMSIMQSNDMWGIIRNPNSVDGNAVGVYANISMFYPSIFALFCWPYSSYWWKEKCHVGPVNEQYMKLGTFGSSWANADEPGCPWTFWVKSLGWKIKPSYSSCRGGHIATGCSCPFPYLAAKSHCCLVWSLCHFDLLTGSDYIASRALHALSRKSVL